MSLPIKRIPDASAHVARVLIVDDESHNRQLLEVMLAAEGLLFETATSGEEALVIVAARPPDLILLDIMMPGMDGYEVARMLKGSFATKHIPLIMVTALDDRDARMRGLTAGAEDFLSKPVDRAELRVRVRNLLRLKAYGDDQDTYSQLLEEQVALRTADLRLERDRAQRYLDTAEIMLLALDVNGRITLVNRYACAILGWTAGELIGREWIETCLPAHVRNAIRQRLRHLLAGDDLSLVENLILTRSGAERLIEWRNTVVRDDTGQVTGIFSSGADITDRHQAVEALRTAEERMRFALQGADVGIWDMDYTTGVLEWSEIIEGQYGLRPGAFEGTFEAFIDHVHPDDKASVLETFDAAVKSGADFTIENRSLWPDGTIRSLSGAGRILLDPLGAPLRGVGISQDITERRTLEGKYQQAQKMEAIGRLAAGIAHDFNNHLTVILGFAEIVAADPSVSRRYGEDLGEVVMAARRAGGLIKQLLAFSRQQLLRATPLDANAVITEMAGMLGRLIGEHIAVDLILAPSLSHALVDRGQLEQVVMNLVVNARDAMAEGGTVTIETTDVMLEDSSFHQEPVVPGPYVMIAVTDTGGGMTKDTERRLFEPFFTTKEVGRGTGLGLSTTYGIVKQSKGYIWVYSELGVGTSFKVYLPRSDGEVPRPSLTAPVVTSVHGSETVLLVEDEPGVRLLSKRILDNAGYRVLEAANGDAAERLFADHADSIDLLVTDVIMPGCGGPELLSRLQVHAPRLRVLYMSGYTEQSAAQIGLDRGLPFVQKPFTAAELVHHVREALDR